MALVSSRHEAEAWLDRHLRAFGASVCSVHAGLALVIPSGQSLVADYYSSCSRGSAFGALYLTGAMGGMLGSLFATNLGELAWPGVTGFQRRPVLLM